MNPLWYDLFRLWQYANAKDPESQISDRQFPGAGTSQPDAVPDIRSDGSFWGGSKGQIRLRETNDFIDLSTVTNRQNRYREYERLRNVAEIEFAMNVFADEACVAGSTKIATPFWGNVSIEWLAENKKDEKFAVYCWDFEKQDFTIGWAYDPRLVKEAETIEFFLDNGTKLIVTEDHKLLMSDNTWREAGKVEIGEEFKAFYKIEANQEFTKLGTNQYPRIYTYENGWVHERQFIDEWRAGKPDERYEKANKARKWLAGGMSLREIQRQTGHNREIVKSWIEKEGFSLREIKWLGNKPLTRRVIAKRNHAAIKVYDLSVEVHKNFCTEFMVCHNCQKGENGHPFEIQVKDKEVKEELEFLFRHKKMLNLDQKKLWNYFKNLFVFGDSFFEIIINPDKPSDGIMNIMPLPADSMYRIETTKGKLLEFQQSKEGPDYQSLSKVEVTKATMADLQQATAIRFAAEQIIHIKVGDDRKTFYPYGISLIEAARGPAHQLRLMEDAMVVYRLVRAPERRVFYIDVQQLPPFKAEAFIKRMKDQFRKKKVATGRVGDQGGAGKIEERWHSQPMDEDFWIPVRPNSNTRIETLPGACLALDTEIPLLDGRVLKLSEIINEFNQDKQLWAYSCNPQTGEPVPGIISWAGVTRKNTKVLKVTFDNGKSITCTPDHNFPVWGKGKTEAQNLVVGDSMIAFNTRQRKIKKNTNEYTQVYDHSKKQYVFAHRMVANFVKGTQFECSKIFNEKYEQEEKNVIHHYDLNRYNNDPTNLYWMFWRDHFEYHKFLPTLIDREKLSASIKKYHNNLSEEQKRIRDNILKIKSKKGTESLGEKLKTDPIFRENFINKQKEGWEKALEERSELHKNRGKKISTRNYEFWSNAENKEKAFKKQTVVYPQSIFGKFKELLAKDILITEIIKIINSSESLVTDFVEANKHIVRKSFKPQDGLTIDHTNKMVRAYGYKGVRQLRNSLGDKTKNQSESTKLFGKVTVSYPHSVFAFFMKKLNEGVKVDDILILIKNNKELMNDFLEANKCVKRKGIDLNQGIKRTHVSRMVKSYGYENLEHARSESGEFNHKVLSIEWLDEPQDTGTLTIDGKHLLHNYHNFAIFNGIFTCNSSLGEIDDAIYFRNKLFVALQFPKNYINQEDPGQTRISLSQQDSKFSRYIERLQSYMEDGLWEIAERHMKLRGFPEERYEDLIIRMTPPSEYRELSQAEVITNRINNAGSLKGAQLMSDYDILTKWLKYDDVEAKEIIARLKIQKLEDLKLQVMAQNPILLGVGTPSNSNEPEMGTEPGGPNPNIGPDGQPMPQQQQQPPMPEGGEQPQPDMQGLPQGEQKSNQAEPLPEISDDEAKKYDLEIQDYAQEQDVENIDYSSEDEG